MNLDDPSQLQAHDTTGLLAAMDAWPEQVSAAADQATALPLPDDWRGARQVVLAGVGGGALAAELVAALGADECPAPLLTWRGFDVPASVGKQTLVVALSPMGEDEVALSAIQAARARGAWLWVLSAAGPIADQGRLPGSQAWSLPAAIRPELAVGPLAVLALSGLARLGLAATPGDAVAGAAVVLRAQRDTLRAESPVVRNPAKRMAGQLMDRLPFIFGAGPMAAAARYWRCQINLLAKAPAAWDEVPEMDQNAVAGTAFPEPLVSRHLVLALRSSRAPERLRWLVDETRAVYMRAGFNTDVVEGSGDSALAHALTAMQYGDYAACYLAVCYGVDPAAGA